MTGKFPTEEFINIIITSGPLVTYGPNNDVFYHRDDKSFETFVTGPTGSTGHTGCFPGDDSKSQSNFLDEYDPTVHVSISFTTEDMAKRYCNQLLQLLDEVNEDDINIDIKHLTYSKLVKSEYKSQLEDIRKKRKEFVNILHEYETQIISLEEKFDVNINTSGIDYEFGNKMKP